ncbi:MAG: KH domain-containing protein [Patescibacteria group bacterium]|nr:KH domain-containing protein [Patescibacteria group bacterium]
MVEDIRDVEFVDYIVKSIVENPDKVQINRTVDEMGVLLELTVDKSDMAVIIGKEGKTVNAIRTLLRVLGAKNNARVNLKIIEPEGGEGEAPKEAAEEEPKAEEVTEEQTETPAEEAEAKEEEPLMADLKLDETEA